MLTRKAAIVEIAKLQSQLAVHQHETRKSLKIRLKGTADQLKVANERISKLEEALQVAHATVEPLRRSLALAKEHMTEEQLALFESVVAK